MTDRHRNAPPPDAEALERMRERLYAFCFPNVPRTEGERAAFERAALLQYEHEASAETDMPRGTKQFRLGSFQMTLDTPADGPLTARSICPAAYGELLRQGLLYRGAEGRGAHAD